MRCAILFLGLCLLAATAAAQADSLNCRLVGRCAASGPTIVRGVLLFPQSISPSLRSSLLDASGRMVLGLKPGPNDVSNLAPDVYFVRREPQAIREVILAR
jgi:hypothetical protein